MLFSGARYRVKRRLAVGGMAEIFLASLVGEAGFERPVILKKILPNLAGDPDFVSRLVDEGLLASRLTHANVVQILDLGRLGPDYFIAMEYVEGPDLREVLRKAQSTGFQIPAPIAAHILWQVSRGLAYAHEKRDNRGLPLGIVHRDVSPANVLLSWEGQVKLTDFGIAKANRKLSVTIPGLLQGKFPYMSPEQGEGDELDCRSDVFSFGTVAYELLSLKRPFDGASDLKTLDAIRSTTAPVLREARAGLPEELVAIVTRCMQRERGLRYSSGADLERAMAALMHEQGWVVTDADVADFLAMLFGDEANVGKAGEEVVTGDQVSVPLKPEELVNVQWGHAPVAAAAPEGTLSVRVPDWRVNRRRRRMALAGIMILLLVLVAAVGVAVWAPWRGAEVVEVAVPVEVAAVGASVELPAVEGAGERPEDGSRGRGGMRSDVSAGDVASYGVAGADVTGVQSGGATGAQRVSDQDSLGLHEADERLGSESQSQRQLLWRPVKSAARLGISWHRMIESGARGAVESAQRLAVEQKRAAEQRPTHTQLTVLPTNARVSVDGVDMGGVPALVTLTPGQSRSVVVGAPGYKEQRFSMSHPGPRKLHKNLEAEGLGKLALRYFPANGTLTIDGRVVAGQNGLNIVEMELPTGAHTIRIVHEGRETVKTVIIEKDRPWRGTISVE